MWLGFGALLPVLPLYFTEQGVDLALLGLVIAAWPAARLVGEPIFGYLADRTARVPLMVIGLIATGIFSFLPLVFTGPLAFVLLRAGSGLATAAYDPAARGYLTDATPPDRRGEAFGLYGAVADGRAASRAGDRRARRPLLRRDPLRLRVRCRRRVPGGHPDRSAWSRDRARTHPAPAADSTQFPPEAPSTTAAGRHRHRRRPRRTRGDRPVGPRRLWNRGLIAALVINAGGYFAGGTYEVIWSLFLQKLGAGLDLIGLTFAMFGLPVLLLSPFAGRLVDRRGSRTFIVIGSILPAVMGLAYTRISDPLLAIPMILIEATGFAMLNPALYAVVAANSPTGPVIDRAGHLRRGRHGRLHRRIADRRRPRRGGHRLPVLRVQRGAAGESRGRAADRRAAPGRAARGIAARGRRASRLSLSTAAPTTGRMLLPARPCQVDRVPLGS